MIFLGLLLKPEEVDCVQVSGYNMFIGNLGGVATVWDISSQVNKWGVAVTQLLLVYCGSLRVTRVQASWTWSIDNDILQNHIFVSNVHSTVRCLYFATAVFALFLCEILIKYYTQWQF